MAPTRRPDSPGAAVIDINAKLREARDHCVAQNFPKALEICEAVLTEAPDDHRFLEVTARSFAAIGQLDRAEAAARKFLELQPYSSRGHEMLARVLHDKRHLTAAHHHVHEAIRLGTPEPRLLQLAGTIALSMGRFDEAKDSLLRAIDGGVADADTIFRCGQAMVPSNPAGAEKMLRKAIDLVPGHADARSILGTLVRGRDPEEAAREFEAVLAIAPRHPAALPGLAILRIDRCDWRDHEWMLPALQQLAEETVQRSALPTFSLEFAAGVPLSPTVLTQLADLFGRHAKSGVEPLPAVDTAHAGRRLRIGYIADDFGPRSPASRVLAVIAQHDSEHFDAHLFRCARRSTPPPAGFGDVRRWHELGGMEAQEAAREVRSHGIDVLVDLDGPGRGLRPSLLAARPAPVQASWLGSRVTWGSGGIVDYVFLDRVVLGPFEEPLFSEAPVFLPACCEPPDDSVLPDGELSRADVGLPEDRFVVFCPDHGVHLGPEAFECYLLLLSEIDDAVLWIAGARPEVVENLREEAVLAGVDPERLHFTDPAPRSRMLGLYGLADLAVSCSPNPTPWATTDALLGGLPVLAFADGGTRSRIPASVLSSVGFWDCEFQDAAAMRGRAAMLAGDRDALAALRERVAQAGSTPTLDSRAYVAGLEACYTQLWDRHRAGESPTALDVTLDDVD